jgi:hypothetical protein
MTELVAFEYDAERSQSRFYLRLPPTSTPRADLDLRIEAWGSEYPDSNTLFALFDGDERFYTLRPLHGVRLFLDGILTALAYTVRVQHGPESSSEWVVELDEQTMKHLADVRYHVTEQANR